MYLVKLAANTYQIEPSGIAWNLSSGACACAAPAAASASAAGRVFPLTDASVSFSVRASIAGARGFPHNPRPP